MTKRNICRQVSLRTETFATDSTNSRIHTFPWRFLKSLVVVCFLIVCVFGGMPTTKAENLLKNVNFNEWSGGAPDDWAYTSDLTLTKSTQNEARTEPGFPPLGHAAIVEKAPGEDGWLYQYVDVPFEEGQHVQFSVWLRLHEDSPDELPKDAIKIHVTNDSASAADRDRPGGATMVNLDELRHSVTPIKEKYTKFKVIQEIRPGTKSIAASIRIAADAGIKFYVDEAEITLKDEIVIPGPLPGGT